jgi:hypothetical protein
MSVSCGTVAVSLTLYARNIPNTVCAVPPEDKQVMLETCRDSWFSINWMKRASRWFQYAGTHDEASNPLFAILRTRLKHTLIPYGILTAHELHTCITDFHWGLNKSSVVITFYVRTLRTLHQTALSVIIETDYSLVSFYFQGRYQALSLHIIMYVAGV